MKIKFLILVFLSLVVAACAKKDEPPSSQEKQQEVKNVSGKDSNAQLFKKIVEDDFTLHGLADLEQLENFDFLSFEIRNAYDFQGMENDLNSFKDKANVFKMHFEFNSFNKERELHCLLEVVEGKKVIATNKILAKEGEDVIFYPSLDKQIFVSGPEVTRVTSNKRELKKEDLFLTCQISDQKSFTLKLRKDLIVKNLEDLNYISMTASDNYQVLDPIKKTIRWDYLTALNRLVSEAVGYYGALLFENTLYTHGNLFKIDTKKLILKNAIIKSFDAKEKFSVKINPQFARDGLAGGLMFIKTVQVFGGLILDLTGQDGEKGKEGNPGTQVDECVAPDRGGDGSDGGDCGAVSISYSDRLSATFNHAVYSSCTVGKKGQAGSPGSLNYDFEEEPCRYNGIPGNLGADGKMGFQYKDFNWNVIEVLFDQSGIGFGI